MAYSCAAGCTAVHRVLEYYIRCSLMYMQPSCLRCFEEVATTADHLNKVYMQIATETLLWNRR